ncbi:hypothetical protein GQG94_004277 [Salmonella enterica]|nr:hypothetical protein [Salmonella enterica]
MHIMTYKKLVLLTASAITLMGCSSKPPELPKPEGERIALNQMGIPAELAIEINRQSFKAAESNKTAVKPVVSTLSPVVANTNGFLHAKNNQDVAKAASNPVVNSVSNKVTSTVIATANNTVSKNPFTGASKSVEQKNNSIVSPKMSAPIVSTASTKSTLAVNNNTNVASAAPKQANVINPVPIKLQPVGKSWGAKSGETLKGVVNRWAAGEFCAGVNKWQVVWPLLIDYRIDSPLNFNGEYFEVLNKLFDLYRKADVPLFVDVYKSQCIISVTDKPNQTK